ncbi:MAG: hypothetical protein NTX50_31895 [Candidatus Sumerlaeota bacterium]|nr:hypothetical protein [Candidatus Sumerlaeota bacterium]
MNPERESSMTNLLHLIVPASRYRRIQAQRGLAIVHAALIRAVHFQFLISHFTLKTTSHFSFLILYFTRPVRRPGPTRVRDLPARR